MYELLSIYTDLEGSIYDQNGVNRRMFMMNTPLFNGIVQLSDFNNRVHVFRDRIHAGEVLAEMLMPYRQESFIILGIPAGGVPVTGVVAKKLQVAIDVAVVSKITLPWNTEVGYGAVAFDGTVRLNRQLIRRFGLTSNDIDLGKEKTTAKVKKRVEKLRGNRPFPDLSGRTTILIDDGLASGFTMLVAVEALHKLNPGRLIVAVPTGHMDSVERIAGKVDAVFCANIRSGWQFAVADAYEKWSDVEESEVVSIMGKMAV